MYGKGCTRRQIDLFFLQLITSISNPVKVEYYEARCSTPVIPATWEVDIGALQFKAS
jgi:hypothetical protein